MSCRVCRSKDQLSYIGITRPQTRKQIRLLFYLRVVKCQLKKNLHKKSLSMRNECFALWTFLQSISTFLTVVSMTARKQHNTTLSIHADDTLWCSCVRWTQVTHAVPGLYIRHSTICFVVPAIKRKVDTIKILRSKKQTNKQTNKQINA